MSARNRCECKISKWPSRSKRTSRASANGSNRLCDLSKCTGMPACRKIGTSSPSPESTAVSTENAWRSAWASSASKWISAPPRSSEVISCSTRIGRASTCTAPSNSGARRAVSNAPSPMPTTASNTDQLEGGYAARGGGVDLTAAVR